MTFTDRFILQELFVSIPVTKKFFFFVCFVLNFCNFLPHLSGIIQIVVIIFIEFQQLYFVSVLFASSDHC